MTQQAELLKEIDGLPPKYLGEVIDFAGYLRQKAVREASEITTPSGGDGKLHLTRAEIDELMQDCPHTLALSGILAGMGDIDLDEVRMERLAKHLK